MPNGLGLRLSLVVLVALFVFNGLWFLAVPTALYAMFRFDAFEYIILAWLIDVYYAPTSFSFWYTGLTLVTVVFVAAVRPYLRWRRYEAE